MRFLFVVLAMCSLVACQKQEVNVPPVATADPDRRPNLEFIPSDVDWFVQRGQGVYVPMKAGPKAGALLYAPPDRFITYYLENGIYKNNAPFSYTAQGKEVRLADPGPNGKLHITPKILSGIEYAVVRRSLTRATADAYIQARLAEYVPTPTNPKGGLVYESPVGDSFLYRLARATGVNPTNINTYQYVEDAPHILENRQAHVRPAVMASFKARLARP